MSNCCCPPGETTSARNTPNTPDEHNRDQHSSEAALSADTLRRQVRGSYAQVALASDAGECHGTEAGCCGVSDDGAINRLISTRLGYSAADLAQVPEGADMGLGCGNPRAIAALQAGEVVLDLGSGGGFDAFLAAAEVGANGRVIGVDMTAEMISKARANALKGAYSNVEFRLGEIEYLPVADATVDVIISNCVINLSPDKQRVFREAWRVLKPGGRLAISDVVAACELPEEIKHDAHLYSACVGGASTMDTLRMLLADSGFVNIDIIPKDSSREFIRDWAPGRAIEDLVFSAYIEAVKA